MTQISRNLPQALKATIDAAVRSLHQRVPAAIGCVIATVDGRLVSHVVDNEADPPRIAAMIGSMVALGETIGREMRIDRSQYVVVNALNGTLLAQRVPSRKELFVVSTLARPTTNLGILLHETRTTAAEIGRALDEWLDRYQAATAAPVVTG
jgi:predicted regulator of Ras-like GTPase activity (Roadblock/LC7/MglB family)